MIEKPSISKLAPVRHGQIANRPAETQSAQSLPIAPQSDRITATLAQLQALDTELQPPFDADKVAALRQSIHDGSHAEDIKGTAKAMIDFFKGGKS